MTDGPWVDLTDLVEDAELITVVGPESELDDVARGYTLTLEGQCPHGHGPLERHEDYGWCDRCDAGWSVLGHLLRFHQRISGTGRVWMH